MGTIDYPATSMTNCQHTPRNIPEERSPREVLLFAKLWSISSAPGFFIHQILIKKTNIVRFIKSQRLRWAAHVIIMDTTRTVEKVTEWEPRSSRPVERPRLRWFDQVEEDLKKMKVRNWREKCKDRRLWNEIVK